MFTIKVYYSKFMVNSKDVAILLETLQESSSLESLQNNFQALCEHFFIEYFAFATFHYNLQTGVHFNIFDTYPNGWIKYYQDNNYQLHDPVFKLLYSAYEPYVWGSKKITDLIPMQKKLLSEAYDHGIKFGTTIPMVFSPYERDFLTILNQATLHPDVVYILVQAIQVYKERQQTLYIQQTALNLTHREWEIMQFKALGLKVKTIAGKLNLNEGTVLFHLKNIKDKMKEPSLENALYQFGVVSR